ncbi:MAG: metalloregulator ArsR/SmtB family transcription factor [Dissulfuribacterales bacterium]
MSNKEALVVTTDIFKLHASFCGIFSSDIRLRIMWLLAEGEKTVTELANALSITVANVSQHLSIMRSLGAVASRREGRAIYYHIANQKFFQGAVLIREGLLEEMQKRLNAVQSQQNMQETEVEHEEIIAD